MNCDACSPLLRFEEIRRSFAEDGSVSLDKSLRRGSNMGGTRNVLKRAERLKQLESEDRWTDGSTVLGMPKVRVIRNVVGKKKKKKVKDEDEDK